MAKGPLIYRQRILTHLTHWVWAVCLFFLLLTGGQVPVDALPEPGG